MKIDDYEPEDFKPLTFGDRISMTLWIVGAWLGYYVITGWVWPWVKGLVS